MQVEAAAASMPPSRIRPCSPPSTATPGKAASTGATAAPPLYKSCTTWSRESQGQVAGWVQPVRGESSGHLWKPCGRHCAGRLSWQHTPGPSPALARPAAAATRPLLICPWQCLGGRSEGSKRVGRQRCRRLQGGQAAGHAGAGGDPRAAIYVLSILCTTEPTSCEAENERREGVVHSWGALGLQVGVSDCPGVSGC